MCEHPDCKQLLHEDCRFVVDPWLEIGKNRYICNSHDAMNLAQCETCDVTIFRDSVNVDVYNCDACGLDFHHQCNPAKKHEYNVYCPDCYQECAPMCTLCDKIVVIGNENETDDCEDENLEGFECGGCNMMFHWLCATGHILDAAGRNCCDGCWDDEYCAISQQTMDVYSRRKQELIEELKTQGLMMIEGCRICSSFIETGAPELDEVVRTVSDNNLYRTYCPFESFLQKARGAIKTAHTCETRAIELIEDHLSLYPHHERQPWLRNMSIFKWRQSVEMNQ